MKVLIKEIRKTVGVNIYGIDGNSHTREFFENFFTDVEGVYATPEEERKEFNSSAEWTIEREEDFLSFAKIIEDLQRSIDEVQKHLINGASINEYTFDNCCYIV